jgi:hypothetical protein
MERQIATLADLYSKLPSVNISNPIPIKVRQKLIDFLNSKTTYRR